MNETLSRFMLCNFSMNERDLSLAKAMVGMDLSDGKPKKTVVGRVQEKVFRYLPYLIKFIYFT